MFLKKAYNRVTTLIEQRGGECAVMRAYVLVEATVRGAKVASEKILALELADTKIVAADIVTGPTDVIVRLESHDLEALGHAIAAIQQVEGAYMIAVKRTSLLFGIVYGALLFKEQDLGRHLAAGVLMVAGVFLIAV